MGIVVEGERMVACENQISLLRNGVVHKNKSVKEGPQSSPDAILKEEEQLEQNISGGRSLIINKKNKEINNKNKLVNDEKKLVENIGKSLDNLFYELNKNNNSKKKEGPFIGKSIPKISCTDYLKRMMKYQNEWQKKTKATNESLGFRSIVIGLIYIDRLCMKQQNFEITKHNIHRILMIVVLLAAKFMEDIPFPNSFWARVGGVGLSELNALEGQFLNMINFDLYIDPEQYQKTLQMMYGQEE